MRITKIGTDYIKINEENYTSSKFQKIPRVHLIKFDFLAPNPRIVNHVLRIFPRTNRFVVEDNIKDYNAILRRTSKKYYVMNQLAEIDHFNSGVISFFRKNNKVLLNFLNLAEEEQNFFMMHGIFEDVLKNTEVIAINKQMYDEKMQVLDSWKGNVIIIENGTDI